MRGVFDDQEMERAHQRRETELTLGSGTLLALFLGLVLLCALCFGMGYSMGHRSPNPSATTTPQAASEQEPLQASGAIPKPSAVEQTPVAQPADAGAPDQSGTAATAAQTATPSAEAPAGAPQGTTPAQPAVRPALPANASEAAPLGAAQAIHPAIASQPFVVQIAAVSNPVDADVLVGALRKRDYPVSARREPADNLIHVRIGPFANRAIADQWRMKLLNDGYNAIIQP